MASRHLIMFVPLRLNGATCRVLLQLAILILTIKNEIGTALSGTYKTLNQIEKKKKKKTLVNGGCLTGVSVFSQNQLSAPLGTVGEEGYL